MNERTGDSDRTKRAEASIVPQPLTAAVRSSYAIRTVTDRFRQWYPLVVEAYDRSRFRRITRRIIRSAVGRVVRSAVGRVARRVVRRVVRSAVGRVVRRVETAVWNASVVQWWLRDPERGPIVVDLTDSLTVGPVVVRLVPLVDRLRASWPRSRSKSLFDRSIDEIRRSFVRIVCAVVLSLGSVALVLTWSTWPLILRSALLASTLVAAVGVVLGGSVKDVTQSRIGRVILALVEPPPEPNAEERR